MYNPIKDGVDKTVQSVQYTESKPPENLSHVVHSFWEMKTEEKLPEDFCLHALPDACVNILFNLADTEIAGITALRTTYEVLNLGREFHYAGIQILPGMWQGDPDETSDRFVGAPYRGNLPLVQTNKALSQADYAGKRLIFAALTQQLIDRRLVELNPMTAKILSHLDSIQTVADMAAETNMSARQLQRTLKKSTGFSPHDFLKVLRLQQSFKQHYLDTYTDQSHFIHCFRKITGYTPAQYFRKFDV